MEVSFTSLAYDRTEKMSLYAKAGISEYWIVNLVNRQVEVHRMPQQAEGAAYGWNYREVQIFPSGASVSPLCRPGAVIAVSNLLPPVTAEQP